MEEMNTLKNTNITSYNQTAVTTSNQA